MLGRIHRHTCGEEPLFLVAVDSPIPFRFVSCFDRHAETMERRRREQRRILESSPVDRRAEHALCAIDRRQLAPLAVYGFEATDVSRFLQRRHWRKLKSSPLAITIATPATPPRHADLLPPHRSQSHCDQALSTTRFETRARHRTPRLLFYLSACKSSVRRELREKPSGTPVHRPSVSTDNLAFPHCANHRSLSRPPRGVSSLRVGLGTHEGKESSDRRHQRPSARAGMSLGNGPSDGPFQ
jgi:hypothetical protein